MMGVLNSISQFDAQLTGPKSGVRFSATGKLLAIKRASLLDRQYFERVARLNRSLPCDPPPESLAEMFDRLEMAERQLGSLVRPGKSAAGDGDLVSHIAFLQRLRSVGLTHGA